MVIFSQFAISPSIVPHRTQSCPPRVPDMVHRHEERVACSDRTQTIPAANKKTIPAQSPAIKPLANSPARISKPKKVRTLVRSLTNTYPRVYPLHAFLRICELVCSLLRPGMQSASL